MASIAPSQMTFSFEPSLPERFPSLRSYIAHRTPLLSKSAKVIAADMDMSPSTLSRKLNPTEGDTQRFNLDDLEQYIASTGEAPAVIEYLAAKFMDSEDARKARALSKVEKLSSELASALAMLKGAT
jgi:hypothetical protein